MRLSTPRETHLEIKKPANYASAIDMSLSTKHAMAPPPESILGGNSSIQDAADGTDMLMMMMEEDDGSLESGN